MTMTALVDSNGVGHTPLSPDCDFSRATHAAIEPTFLR